MNHKWQINTVELNKVRLSRESKQIVMDMAQFAPRGNWPTCDYSKVTPELLANGVVFKSDAEYASHASYEVAARFVS